jgi:hypothetical protein
MTVLYSFYLLLFCRLESQLVQLKDVAAKAANRAQISRLQKKQKPFKFPFTFLA